MTTNHFPQNLANYRRSKRLRSHQASQQLQLSRTALKAYESGECMPTPEMLVKLARIMGVSVAGLVGQRIIFCDK
ncbi:helix-turn-helix domain-containing protein [Sphingobacterium multivorum]|uniref:helix-turn-helix domain-containing protein n=1 Tax=Sphingobacterium multivorum TaxID=28454 RepID=UPI003DA59B0C